MNRIKGTGESTLVMDSTVPLMHHDPDRSWIADPDPDHPKGTQPLILSYLLLKGWRNHRNFEILDGTRPEVTRYVQYSDKFSYSIVLYFIVLPRSQMYCIVNLLLCGYNTVQC